MISKQADERRTSSQHLRSNARRMRHEPTDAEHKFWLAVRARRFCGYKFKRQYPVGPYIVDFVCLDHHLIVELDGGQHAEHVAYDAERTAYLGSRGFRVLRYWNDEFLRTPDVILEDIWRVLNTPSPASCARDLSPYGGEVKKSNPYQEHISLRSQIGRRERT